MKTTPKDFFLHFGATIFLYVSAVAIMNLFFSIADKALPDALNPYFSAGSIVWPVSMLIVLVPLVYLIEWLIHRDIVAMPQKKDIWIRRWRIYLTLFLTGLTIAGDLIFLINTYLNGEITGRFIWKVLIVLAVSVAIFAYYLLTLFAHSGAKRTWRKVLAWFGIVLVIGAIVGGFVVVGSPAHQRALRFDEQRVSDLSNIQSQIVNSYQQTGSLPVSIQSLNDPISGFIVPVDPETGAAYEYSRGVTALEFQLCATFDVQSDKSNASPLTLPAGFNFGDNSNNWVWDHPAGHFCVNRTIDPNRYPVLPKPAMQ